MKFYLIYLSFQIGRVESKMETRPTPPPPIFPLLFNSIKMRKSSFQERKGEILQIKQQLIVMELAVLEG